MLIKGKVETVTADHVKPAHISKLKMNKLDNRPGCQKLRLYGENSRTSDGRGRKKKYCHVASPEAGVCMKQNLNGHSTVKTKPTAPEANRRGEKPVEQSNTKINTLQGAACQERHNFSR